jgi:hypothetical protein
LSKTHPFACLLCGSAWTHTPSVAVARGGDAPPLFLRPETFLNTIPACKRASL